MKHFTYACVHALLLTTFLNFSTQANEMQHTGKPNDMGPAGIMGDHSHAKGMWMTTYRYSQMKMKQNQDGTHAVDNASVLANFMMTPLDMSMDMHMFGLMYGATNNLTLMTMVPYIHKSMQSLTRMGVRFRTASQGLGDIKLSGVYTLYPSGDHQGHHHHAPHQMLLQLGASLPTGSITKRDGTPVGPNQKLPYPMQLGSGTIDPILGITYSGRQDDWSWGSQTNATLRFGKNNEGYRVGNQYQLTGWVARNLNNYTSLSFRLDGNAWGNVHGRDRELNPMMAPSTRTDLRGGERVDALVGINLYQPKGPWAQHRLAAEFGVPLYQRLNGPQLETDYRLMLGWQWSF
ncbi:MAG: transporter [Rickettsiales bacterium]|nr:transporter [Rickettsiales bacterium]